MAGIHVSFAACNRAGMSRRTGMTDTTPIEVRGISKKYCRKLSRSILYGIKDIWAEILGRDLSTTGLRPDEFWAVKDANFKVGAGECMALIGANGAGKSTLLKMLNGILAPDQGEIRLRGRVGALIEVGAGFHPLLTGRENIYVSGAIFGYRKKEMDKIIDDIISFSELEEFIDSPVMHYSSGMYIRLGFSIVAFTAPDVLLVDEALSVGDAFFRYRSQEKIRELQDSGTAIVYVTHNLHSIPVICDSACILDQNGCSEKMESARAVDIFRKSMTDKIRHAGSASFGQLRSSIEIGESNLIRSGPQENVKIQVARILSDGDQPTSQYCLEDKITVEVVVSAVNDIDNVGAAFLIRDANGVNVTGWTSHHAGCSCNLVKGDTKRFRFTLQNVFQPEVYSISVTASWLPEGNSLGQIMADDRIDNALFFESKEKPGQNVWTRIQLPVECSVQN
jgi:ABC-type polysaccharide/polyol phosphate transport system ATPase subunit